MYRKDDMADTAPLPYRMPTIWVVVADHAQAHVYVRRPRNLALSRHSDDGLEVLTWNLDPLPGLSLEGGPDESLPLEIADRLNHAFAEGRFDGVVIVAPPAWLGHMRPHLTRDARDAVISEIEKDLTKLPRARLLQRINDILPSREGAPL